MFEIEVIRILSIVLLVGTIGRFAVLAFFTKKHGDLGSVKASKPVGFVLHDVWLLLDFLPLIFYLLGTVIPSWIYGTVLNVSLSGGKVLQALSVPLFLIGAILTGWSDWALGALMRPKIEVMENHDLVTKGPYSRIRHPTYAGIMMMTLASAFLFLHVILILGFFACVGIAYKKAVLEEQLLASESGFGQTYHDYMSKTGRFLPKL